MAKYMAGARAKCPHCLTVVRFENLKINRSIYPNSAFVMFDYEDTGDQEPYRVYFAKCPSCGKFVVTLARTNIEMGVNREDYGPDFDEQILRPLNASRPVPKEVPEHIAGDYGEAAIVLSLSPKASAALSRRCLQTVLREAGGFQERDLSKQIDAALPTLPTYTANQVDAIRNIGNFAAHPNKSQSTGEIVEVETGEAEWNLDVLDLLFDHYYVGPKIAEKKRAALDQKLQDAGKPPLKQP